MQSLLLMYGPPSCGKSTIVKESCLSNLSYVSVGTITRKEIREGTYHGLQLKNCLQKDIPYPPKLISGVISPHILKEWQSGNTVILDGFPKYTQEIPEFNRIIRDSEIQIGGIIHFNLPYDLALKRVENRRICSACGLQANICNECPKCEGKMIKREDDLPNLFEKRFQDYMFSLSTILHELGDNPVYEIDASGVKDEIARNFEGIIKNIGPGSSAERAAILSMEGQRFKSFPGLQKKER